ncbi:MAG: hypothetical protein EOP81_09050 [Variovorax sp.]|nr:MAG: hypothetical protein EOP81_09050 [Variovorax sp.]
MKKLLLMSILTALAAPFAAQAESVLVAPALANAQAAARLDFRITIPRVLFLQVGTGTSFTSNASVDLIDFTVPAATVGNGTAVAATAVSGNLTNGAVTVRVMGNGASTISLNSSTTGPMTNGAGSTVGWNRIAVVAAPLTAGTTPGFNNTGITHPTFAASNTGNGTATTLNATNGVVREEGRWTFSYLNQDVLAAGTYGGVDTNAGRVTYTATMP